MTADRSIRGQRAVAWPSWQHSQRLRGDAPRLGLGKIRKTEAKSSRYAYNFAVRGHRHLEDAGWKSFLTRGGLWWWTPHRGTMAIAPMYDNYDGAFYQCDSQHAMNDVMHDVMMPCMAARLRGTKSFELFGGTHEDCRNRFGQESFVLSLRAPCTVQLRRCVTSIIFRTTAKARPTPVTHLRPLRPRPRLHRCEAKDATTSSLTIHLSEGNDRQRMNPWILSCFLFFFDRPGGLYHNLTDNQD